MGSIMKNLFTSHMRNPTATATATAEEDYIFYMQSIPGDGLKDSITGVPAVISIGGTRYGVVNGVVTQFEANQPPIEDDGLRGCPAFTQFAKMSETLTDGVWQKARINTPVLYGSLNGMNLWQLSEDSTLNTHNILQSQITGITDNSVLGTRCIAKYSGRHLELRIQRKDGSISTICWVNLQTGVINSQLSGSFVEVTPLPDGFFDVFVASSVLNGATSPRIYFQLNDGTSANYTGDGVSGVYISQPTFTNFGVNGIPFIPPYVPNNTTGSISVVSEAATASTGMSFDLDDINLSRLKTALRGPNAQGHLELTFKSNFNSEWFATNTDVGIITLANTVIGASISFRVGPISFIRAYDGANAAYSPNRTFTVNETIKISLDWGTHNTGQKMQITVNGVRSALVDFLGQFGLQDLRFFYGNTVHAGWIVKDSLKIMDRPIW